jgi:import inner membrane translocase subunit TIM50
MPNVPPDVPVPHTLVLDLENTLVSSTWDRKHGWRHAKRPGVDKFLLDMAGYFEIVVFSPSLDILADPVVTALDKSGCIMHRLYRDATHYKNGVYIKDLNSLNRDVKRMIVLDDDPLEVQFQPGNLIRVKPYTDPTDFSDRTLARITPFLIEIVRENYQDIPELLSQYQGMDADQIADEFERRVIEFKEDRERHLQRGLAGLVRRNRDLPPPELPPAADPYLTTTLSTPAITSKDLVGAAPADDSGTGLVAWINRRTKAKEETLKNKHIKWGEVVQRQRKEKLEAEKEAERKAKETAAAQSA